MPRDKGILIVSTSADSFGKDLPTGVWLEELAAAYNTFKAAGFPVTIASIKGGEIPVDKKSRGEGFYTEDAKKFDADKEATAALKASKALADVNPGDYVAIYLPGGHGTVVDFPDSKELIAAINSTYADGAVVGAVCHGPMGLVNCKKPNGEALVKGLEVCSFTDSEEKVMGLTEKVPFLLESKMRSLGAKFKTGADWGSNAVADSSGAGVLVTGQNPASSKAVADLVVKALQK